MLTHETKNGFETQEQAPETKDGVRLSANAAEAISGIFNLRPDDIESIRDIDRLRQLVFEPVHEDGMSLFEALDESIPDFHQVHELDLPYERKLKLEKDRDNFWIGRSFAPHITAWSGRFFVSVARQRYSGGFTAQNGRWYNVGGSVGHQNPEDITGYTKELVKELREVDIALRLKEFKRAQPYELRPLVADKLYQLSSAIQDSERDGTIEDKSIRSTLYDSAGFLKGAEYLDWLLADGNLEIPVSGTHIHLSHEYENEYRSAYHVELCDTNFLADTGVHATQTWLKLGRNYSDYATYTETNGSQVGKTYTLLDNYGKPDLESAAKLKRQLQTFLNISADYVSLSSP